MPSTKPIFPLRMDPELKKRAEALVAQMPGRTLNGWINALILSGVTRGEEYLRKAEEEPQPEAEPARPKDTHQPNRAERRRLAKLQRVTSKK